MQIPESFSLVADLAANLGVRNINTLPGLWKHEVDDEWSIAVNGHAKEVESVPPYSMLIKNKKFFVMGIVNAAGGTIIGGQEAEDAFIAALKRALAKSPSASPSQETK